MLDGELVADGDDEHKRVAHVVAEWLVGAAAAAHADPATKRLARLVLGVYNFAANMFWAGVWDTPFKAGLQRALQALGAPLGAAFAAGGLGAKLGALALPPHALVAADQARCAAAGRAHVLRSDMAGVVPVPAAWAFDKPVARQRHERVFMHMLVLMALALNEQFHGMMRAALGPFVVAGEGIMAQGKDGVWRLTPPKGVARMECKRVTDHMHGSDGVPTVGCRSGLNIDVLRIIGVCATPEQLKAAMVALGALFGGCGRVKNGFAIEDAAFMFHLRTLMTNFIVDFGLTFAQLAARPGVAAMWAEHVEHSAPEGGAPRGRWRAEAAEALAVLTGAELVAQPVRFICEAQMLLDDVYQVRRDVFCSA